MKIRYTALMAVGLGLVVAWWLTSRAFAQTPTETYNRSMQQYQKQQAEYQKQQAEYAEAMKRHTEAMAKYEDLTKRYEKDLELFEKILATHETQQEQYQQYLDSLPKKK
jgi:septal ring factor EnvC (AmiA/AmiB activator)